MRYIYLPFLPQLRERSKQNSGLPTSVLLAWGILAFKIQRLGYRRMGRCITSHLPFILSPRSATAHPLASGPCDIFAIVPRHRAAAPSDLQATVRRRVLAVLAQLWTRIERKNRVPQLGP